MKIAFALTKPQMADDISGIIPKTEDTIYTFSAPELTKTLQQIGNELDYLFVHEEIFEGSYPWEWLSFVKRLTNTKTQIIVILSEQTDSLYREIIKRISIDLSISLIPSGLIWKELSEEISHRLFGKQNEWESTEMGRVVTIFSASCKDGATTIAISTAICMALRMPEKKVLLVDFNLKSPEIRDHLHLTSDRGYPLIQADCDSATLEPGALLKACDQLKDIDNLYILTGIQRRELAEKITMEEVSHLLEVARTEFDMILVDVHSYPDQAATLRCVKEADERLVVVQPIITSYQSSWNDWFNSVWQHYGLTESDFHLVMNRDTKAAMDGLQIERAMGSKIVARIRNAEKGAGIKAINFGEPLYLNTGVEVVEFKANILQLAALLAEGAKLELVSLPTDKKPVFKGRPWAALLGNLR